MILLLSNSGELAAGGELSLLDLAGGISARGFRPFVVCPGPGGLAARLQALGIPVEVVPMPSWGEARVIRIAGALRRLAGLIRTRQIALIHCNATWRMALYAGLAGRWTGVPMIWHVRVGEPEGWKDRLLAALATQIVVNSDAVARRFAGTPGRKVERIYNGVDLSRFAPGLPASALRSRLGLPDGAPVVGSVGRFVAYKGYGHLLEAARVVREKRPEVRWVLVGDGELRGDLEAQCRRLELDGTVQFTGWQDAIPAYLALFDVFVLPSLGEHFGRVLIEAMAMAKPVVATRGGGVPEIVLDGTTGILVAPGDAAALGAAVEALLADPARATRLGEAGRQRAMSEFSLTRHLDAVAALYGRLIGEARRRL